MLLMMSSLVRPILEYGCAVWNPYTEKDKKILGAIQDKAARWAGRSRWNRLDGKWSKSAENCRLELNWPLLEVRRIYLCVTVLHDILCGAILLSHPPTYYCTFNSSVTRAHPWSLVPPQSSINAYRYTFFTNVVFLWNQVPHSILSVQKSTLFRKLLNKFYFC